MKIITEELQKLRTEVLTGEERARMRTFMLDRMGVPAPSLSLPGMLSKLQRMALRMVPFLTRE